VDLEAAHGCLHGDAFRRRGAEKAGFRAETYVKQPAYKS
jgi:hypothetical protein